MTRQLPPLPKRFRPVTRRLASEDGGMIMVMTLIVMFIVVALITVIFTEGMDAMPLARQAQNYQAALQAAESGVQDYINRLDNNTSYYLNLYDSSNPAMENDTSGTPQWTSWAPVSGTSVGEWYRYYVNSQNTAKNGIAYLTVSGAAGQNPATSPNYSVRTISVGISLSGFTSFLYFTDFEIDDPNIVSGFSGPRVNGSNLTYTQDCVYHAWQYNSYTGGYGPDPNYCGGYAIDFVPEDTLDGPIFSNDEFHICGAASFPQGATSAYDQGTANNTANNTSYGNPGSYVSACAGTPNFGGTPPQPAGGSDEPFPATNTNLENNLAASNDGGGCAYAGPVGIVFNNTGTMTVTIPSGASFDSSVLSSSWSVSGCGPTSPGTATVNLPPNGLIYDENPSGCATATCEADVYVSGSVGGQVTVGSQNNITLTGSLKDADNMTGTDIIGLSATNYIVLPDSKSYQLGSTTRTLSSVGAITIQAAMVALDHSFWLPGWASDGVQGQLTLQGSIAQEYRGPVGAHSGTTLVDGYSKMYTYDTRLRYLQPPYFTSPTLPNWTQSSFAECNPTPTPTTNC